MKILVVIFAALLVGCGGSDDVVVFAECVEIERDDLRLKGVDFEIDTSDAEPLEADAVLLNGGFMMQACLEDHCTVASKRPYVVYAQHEDIGVQRFYGVGKVKIEVSDGRIVCLPAVEDEDK